MDEAAPPPQSEPCYPNHVLARRKERRTIARACVALFLGGGTGISVIGVFDAQVAQNIATIWPLLAVLLGTQAAVICTYFGVGAMENNKVESMVALAGRLV